MSRRPHTPPPAGAPPEAMVQAVNHHRAGRLKDAIRLYRKLLKQYPKHPEVLRLAGMAHQQMGKSAEAIALLTDAIKADPSQVDSHCQLGIALAALKRRERALSAFDAALALQPQHLEALVHKGVSQLHGGDAQSAVTTLKQATAAHPDQPQAHYNLGIVCREAGLLDEAISAYRRAGELDAGFAEAHYNLGNLLMESGAPALAVQGFRAAIAARENFAEAHDNLGNALMATGQLAPALSAYQAALELRPNHGRTLNNLGNALGEAGQLKAAMDAYHDALKADRSLTETRSLLVHQMQRTCLWDDIEAQQAQVLDSLKQHLGELRPFPLLAMASSPAQQAQCARDFVTTAYGHLPTPFNHGERKTHPTPPLTIGYLSADFRRHPVASLMVDLLKNHDRGQFKIIAYNYGKDDGSRLRQQIIDACDEFVELSSLPHQQAAQRIYDDGVDILVDLMGHTKHSRMEILAMRPAPIQVLMLGYAGTSGADFIDYIVADEFVIPNAAEAHYSEAPVRLPDCFMPNGDNQPEPGSTPSRADCGLPESGTVFGSFNHPYKISLQVFARWMRILAGVPNSVLWLSRPNDAAEKNLRQAAQDHGIDPDRLVFADKVPSIEDHLARYRVMDLFLDTRPYNAHATASDALWCGCPVLSYPGDSFASRVAGSLMGAIGLDELICDSGDAYETLAIALGNDPVRLAAIRDGLTSRRSDAPLFNSERYARHLEAAFAAIWQRHVNGEAPAPITVTPLP